MQGSRIAAATPRWSRRAPGLQLSRPGLLGVPGPALHLRQHRLQHRLVRRGPAGRPRRRSPLLMRKQLIAGALGAAAVAAAVSLAPSASASVFTVCPSGNAGVVGGHTCLCLRRERPAGVLGLGVQPVRRLLPGHRRALRDVLCGPVHGLLRQRSGADHNPLLRRHQRRGGGLVIKRLAFAGSIVVAALATTSVVLSSVALTLAEALEDPQTD